MIHAFHQYLSHENKKISRAQFECNLREKFNDSMFQKDITPLILNNSVWDINKAMDAVIKNIFPLLQGEPWKNTKILMPL